MVKFIVALFLFFSLAEHARGQALGFSLPEGRNKVHIPIQTQNNLIVVPVILNNVLPLKFIIDTGVRTAILTQKAFSDILQLPYNRKYSIAGPGGEKIIDAYVTSNVSLTLPGVIGRGQALLVLEEDYLELRNILGTDVHGILGYELFSRFIVEINYEKKIMTLSLPHKFHRRRKFEELPMVIEDTKPFILTTLNLSPSKSMTAKLLMDTGASHGLLLEPSSDPKIEVPQNTVSAVIGRGLGGEITGKIGRIESLKLGSFTLDNVLVNFPDPNSYLDTLKRTFTFRHGTIGGEILSRFTVIFDYSQGKVFLKKNASFKKKFFLNLSGIDLKAKGSALNTFEVTSIRGSSPAAKAGIQSGDLLIQINSIRANELKLNEINSMLNSKPGKKINLVIERNNVRRSVQMILETQL